MTILVAALAASSATPAATASANIDQEVRTYMECVRAMAERIEPSGDDPRDVATAAVFMCQEPETAALNAALQNPSTGYTPAKLRETAEFFGAAQATLARLCRVAKDCGLAPVK